MNAFFSEKSIIIAFCFLFTVSTTFLFWQNKRELDPNLGKSWWTLSFAEPANTDSLNFIIENHTSEDQFHYEASYQIAPDKTVSLEEILAIAPGETKIIAPSMTASPDFRTTVLVTIGTEKKEIYRR